MSAHTKGQLVVVDDRDLMTTEGKTIADVLDSAEGLEGDCPEADANAARLALCWNLHDELVAALELRIEDHQCAVSCDGPHEGCPCWYCVACAVLAKVGKGG